MEERAFLMCWLDVLLVECIRIVSGHYLIHQKIGCDFLLDEMFPLTED